MQFSLFPFLIFFPFSLASKCSDAPDESMKHMCTMLQKWENNAKDWDVFQALMKSSRGETIHGQSTVLDCRTIRCICEFEKGTMEASTNTCILPNGKRYGKIRRREYRMMSDEERTLFHNTLLRLKNTPRNEELEEDRRKSRSLSLRNQKISTRMKRQLLSLSSSPYDSLSSIHSTPVLCPSAHAGPGFLPWHREFIKRLEILIRLIEPTLYLPYWDSTLDSRIPDSNHSILYTNLFQGEVNGTFYVNNGPFKYWRGHTGKPIWRTQGFRGRMISDSDVNNLLQSDLYKILGYTSVNTKCSRPTDFTNLEYTHGNPHSFISGDMWITSTSTNDPLFWLHHSFIDLIWEQWRQKNQNRFQRENDYPIDNENCEAIVHFGYRIMSPFGNLTNRDGLSNVYTDELYDYQTQPRCTTVERNCGSIYLFCDISHGLPGCAVKIKNGGKCGGYVYNENMCWNGKCVKGICEETILHNTPIRLDCFDNNTYCDSWAAYNQCTVNPGYMKVYCKKSCGIC